MKLTKKLEDLEVAKEETIAAIQTTREDIANMEQTRIDNTMLLKELKAMMNKLLDSSQLLLRRSVRSTKTMALIKVRFRAVPKQRLCRLLNSKSIQTRLLTRPFQARASQEVSQRASFRL